MPAGSGYMEISTYYMNHTCSMGAPTANTTEAIAGLTSFRLDTLAKAASRFCLWMCLKTFLVSTQLPLGLKTVPFLYSNHKSK